MQNETYETEETPKTLENIIGSPYVFTIKDGTKFGLDEWTIDAEKWAKKFYGSMEKLFNTLMRIGCDDDATVEAALRIASYKLTDESRVRMDELKGELTTEQFLAKNITYKQLAELCRAEFEMIRDSIPLEALEEVKKNNLKTLQNLQTANPNTRAVKKKTKKGK